MKLNKLKIKRAWLKKASKHEREQAALDLAFCIYKNFGGKYLLSMDSIHLIYCRPLTENQHV